MAPVLMRRLANSIETIYAAVALFALTQGPVYQVWGASSLYLQWTPQPSMAHIYFATFVAAQLPAVLLLARNVTTSMLSDRASVALLALMSWIGLTVLWSTFARHSLPEFIALVLTTSFGVYLGTRFSAKTIWRIVASAMAMGLGISLFAIWRRWNVAVNDAEGYWIGIYYNRNSLAPVAAVAVIASIGLIVTGMQTRKILNVSVLLGTALIFVSIIVLWKSESQTSPFALAVAGLALVLWWGLRWISRASNRRILSWSPAVMTLLILMITLFAVLRTVGALSNVPGETTTFNSRGPLWSLSWSGIQLKPWHGWGWQAAWHTSEFFKQGIWWAVWDTTWSHNGYHDLLLGGGFITGGLFLTYLFFAARHIDNGLVSTSAVMFLMMTFVLVAATQESFFIGSHFLWALLIASLSVGVATSANSIE